MTAIIDKVEKRRLDGGLSQKAVAARLGISQPHYSKVVGGVVTLTDDLSVSMTNWLKANPITAAPVGARHRRIRELSRAIERDLRQLNSLLAEEGSGPRGRAPQRTRVRVKREAPDESL